MTRSVDLILPDAGPLISLAHADRLDLLALFGRLVVVLDVVRLECLRKPDASDHPRLAAWFGGDNSRIGMADTPIGPVYRDALERERSGVDPVATRGLGDAALSWALGNIDRLTRPDAVPLVLVEDRRLAIRLQGLGAGHILWTRSWLAALAEAGLVDFDAVVAAMGRRGRGLSTLAVDAPMEGGSRWLGSDEVPDRKPN
ncbi:hypothetical protein [uncultured Sphingomonas sp.]|uniref:hypothetical protein n=1 Tax=uncultured Sphingomonas sp. TaxID=158754 RepID=UPI0035C9D2F0